MDAGIDLLDVLAALDGPGAAPAANCPTISPTQVGRQSSPQPSTPTKRALPIDEPVVDDSSLDPAEAKRIKRMRRNRESAAMSRERKKAYIEELETKLAQLAATVQELQTENDVLRSGRASLEGVAPVTKRDAEQVPPLLSSDNESESDAASLDVFSQEPPCSLSLPAEPAALFGDTCDASPFDAGLSIFNDIAIMGDDEVLVPQHAARAGG